MLLALAALAPGRAGAVRIVADISQHGIAITAGFTGSEILVFGAIKATAVEARSSDPLGVIVTVEGPSERLVVWRKERVAGVWVNRKSIEIDSAPGFYAVASSAPLERILEDTEDWRHAITIPKAIRVVAPTAVGVAPGEFIRALIRLQERAGLYRVQESEVALFEETLFRADFELPANITDGIYKVRIFLTRAGKVIATREGAIEVTKVGLERWLFRLAQTQPLSYGLLSLAIAMVAGWGASVAFRLIRNS